MTSSSHPSAVRFRADLARPEQLVHPQWLARLLAGQAVQAAPGGSWRLFEAGSGESPAFGRGHIDGAGYLDTNLLEALPFWNAVPPERLLPALARLGITCETPVILYGRRSLAAARAAHLLLYAGVRDVRLLDGGLQAWERQGLPLATGPARSVDACVSFGLREPAHPRYLVDLAGARALLALPRDRAVLASIRSHEEFTGQISGYRYIAARGDIPGAVWGRAGHAGDVDSMDDYQDADGCMLPAATIRAFWHAAGIVPHKRVCFYCGTGWRASLAFFYAWLMGWDDICVFDGGWFEWSSDPRNAAAIAAATRAAAQGSPAPISPPLMVLAPPACRAIPATPAVR